MSPSIATSSRSRHRGRRNAQGDTSNGRKKDQSPPLRRGGRRAWNVGLQGRRGAPQVLTRSVRPVVIAAGNGNRSKNKDGLTCVAKAFKMMTSGADVLDAVIAGVNIVELDPDDTSVGYGGLPNADGVVQLDACVMHGPKKIGGAVACFEGVRTPSLVAKKVMEETDHVLLVGKGAQDFARNMGFTIEDDL